MQPMTERCFTVRLDGTSAAFACRDDETVVAAMERAAWLGGIAGDERIAVGCRRGGCGVCRVQVLAGAYRVGPMSRTHVSEAEQREGYALACCLVPQGDLLLRPAVKLTGSAPRAAAATTAATNR